MDTSSLINFFDHLKHNKVLRNKFLKSLLLISYLDSERRKDATVYTVINNYFLELSEDGYLDLVKIQQNISMNPSINMAVEEFLSFNSLLESNLRKVYYHLIFAIMKADAQISSIEIKFLEHLSTKFNYVDKNEDSPTLIFISIMRQIAIEKFKLVPTW